MNRPSIQWSIPEPQPAQDKCANCGKPGHPRHGQWLCYECIRCGVRDDLLELRHEYLDRYVD